MKKIYLLIALSIAFAFLAAVYDEDFAAFSSLSEIQDIDGYRYWVFDDFTLEVDEAIEIASEGGLLLLKAKAGWEKPNLKQHQEIVDGSDGVGVFLYDIENASIYILYILTDEIIENFNNEKFKKKNMYDQLDNLYNYIALNGYWVKY